MVKLKVCPKAGQPPPPVLPSCSGGGIGTHGSIAIGDRIGTRGGIGIQSAIGTQRGTKAHGDHQHRSSGHAGSSQG